MILTAAALGKPILAEIHRLDVGLDIGIYGGDCTHVGAVSLADETGKVQSIQHLGHKDGIVSEKWAAQLAERLHLPVCVRCGIHFDGLCAEELAVVMETCEDLLNQIAQMDF